MTRLGSFSAFLIFSLASQATLSFASPVNPVCVRDPLRKAFLPAAVREASGLIRSPTKRFLYEISGGKWYPELKDFFGPKTALVDKVVTATEVPAALTEIDQTLRGDGFPLLKLQNKNLYATWEGAAITLAHSAEVPVEDLSEYVIFQKNGQIAFAKKGSYLVPIQIEAGHVPVLLNDHRIKLPSSQIPDGWTEESLIREYARKNLSQDSSRIRKMSPVTNDMRYPRDRMFEWEGELIAKMRSNGARTVPNIQELMRTAGRKGLAITDAGKVILSPEIEAPLKRAYDLAFPGRGDFERQFQYFGERQAFHTLTLQYLDGKPELIEKFLASPEYADLAPEFIDKHIAYVGATEADVAKGMIAEMKLYQFEKEFQEIKDAESSHSQQYLARVPEYHAKMEKWMDAEASALPKNVPALVSELKGTGPYSKTLLFTPELKAVVEKAERAIDDVSGQLSRHETHNQLTRLAGKTGIITDTKRSFPNNIIANIGMAKADAEGVYTVSAFFNPERADGYFGPSIPGYQELPRFVPHPGPVSRAEVENMMLQIAKSPSFTEQTQKVREFAPKIAKFLTSDPSVPNNIREFAKTLYGDDFAKTVYSKMGAVYDPNSFNRFFPDGYKDFQKMNMYRYIFDLAHGETSVLVKNNVGKRAYLDRVFMGKWKPYAFEQVDEKASHQALNEVLGAGENRLKRLNHEPVNTPLSAADLRDRFEGWIGWDTYDMKFLRWANHWDEWDAMGGGWNCVCFTRKSIFNPFSIRQF